MGVFSWMTQDTGKNTDKIKGDLSKESMRLRTQIALTDKQGKAPEVATPAAGMNAQTWRSPIAVPPGTWKVVVKLPAPSVMTSFIQKFVPRGSPHHSSTIASA